MIVSAVTVAGKTVARVPHRSRGPATGARIAARVIACVTVVVLSLVGISSANASSAFTVEVSVAHKGLASRSGDAWVTATVTCSRSTSYAETFLTVTEKVHGLPVVAFQDGDVPGGCGRTPTTFRTSAADDTNGIPLKPGRAHVDLQIFACPLLPDGDVNYDQCTWAEVTQTVILTGGRFS